ERVRGRPRGLRPPPVPLPDIATSAVRFPDLQARFAQSLADVGGACVRVRSPAEAAEAVAALPVARSAQQIVSQLPEVLRGTLPLEPVHDPHGFAGVDRAGVPGEVGAAAKSARCITDGALRARGSGPAPP